MLILFYLLIPSSCSETITKDYILSSYNSCNNCDIKHLKYDTIGFITPWNELGFDYATKYWHKFTYLSPVWYNLQVSSSFSDPNSYEITGEANSTFIENVVNLNITSMIVPRVLFNISDPPAYRQLLKDDASIFKLGDSIYNLLKPTIYSGCVLEFWVPGLKAISGFEDRLELRSLQLRMLDMLAKYLQAKNYITLFVTPHLRYKERSDFNSLEFIKVFNNVHRFVLVTYDFSLGEPGPTSPILWVRNCINHLLERVDVSSYDDEKAHDLYMEYRSKLMLGIPFYGYEFNPTNITQPGSSSKTYDSRNVVGTSFIEILNNNQPQLTWQENVGELKAEYIRDNHTVVLYYPIDKTVEIRVQMATRLGTGISIWELGQGLPFHFQVL